eukprot:6462563-Amphidinium_carterae.4
MVGIGPRLGMELRVKVVSLVLREWMVSLCSSVERGCSVLSVCSAQSGRFARCCRICERLPSCVPQMGQLLFNNRRDSGLKTLCAALL